jgi:hypothetical protein
LVESWALQSGCEENTLCVMEWDCCNSCIKIRCQETDSGDCNSRKTLVCVKVNC